MSEQSTQEQANRSAACGACCFLPCAIAAVVIAGQYDSDTSPCGTPATSDSYTVGLVEFLLVGGYTQIGGISLGFCLCCCAMISDDLANAGSVCLVLPSMCLSLFYLAWGGIGLYMYSNELTSDCQQEPIGQVLLAWSLIPYCFAGC